MFLDHTKHEMEKPRKMILIDPHVATDFISLDSILFVAKIKLIFFIIPHGSV